MSKSRVHAKVYVPFGTSTPEICCPSVCQNWSGLPGFNLDGNTRGRDVLLRYYFCRCNSFDHCSWFVINVLQTQTCWNHKLTYLLILIKYIIIDWGVSYSIRLLSLKWRRRTMDVHAIRKYCTIGGLIGRDKS